MQGIPVSRGQNHIADNDHSLCLRIEAGLIPYNSGILIHDDHPRRGPLQVIRRILDHVAFLATCAKLNQNLCRFSREDFLTEPDVCAGTLTPPSYTCFD